MRPPSVERLACDVEAELLVAGSTFPGPLVRSAARHVIESARAGHVANANDQEPYDLIGATLAELGRRAPARRVINATGVLLHTNLGRAPLVLGTVGEPRFGSTGYSDVEFDLETGRRGPRFAGLEASLCALTGAESALVVNNNAAAVLLAVSGLAAGREVVVSRGELVEIGGSFRIPDVITQGGAQLREVGTTNRTHAADYRGALGDGTAALLSVHRSNFRVVGFTTDVSHKALAEVARAGGVPLVVDLGGGLVDTRCGWLDGGPPPWLVDEPGVRQVLAAGADLVTFSGDKLLGGPQGGIIVGAADLVERLRRHPLARALRLDPLRAGLLQQTVGSYLGGTAASTVPFWCAASAPTAGLRVRADRILEQLERMHPDRNSDQPRCSVADLDGTVGAGATPGSLIPGVGIEVRSGSGSLSAADLSTRLRTASVPVVAVVGDDSVRIHLRTVDPGDDALLVDALGSLVGGD